ncbi:MAG: hypothetical protein HY231_19925 [Acidobacteria bacterium]|nr:hypothetical protein [Acidobacteriota bacterium]
MSKRFIIAAVALVVLLASNAAAQQWKRYIPEAQRKEVYKKATVNTGLSAKFISKVNARVLWVTDEVARAIVSDMLDKKYVSATDADSEYFDLRPFSHFLFYLFIKVDKKTLWGPLDQQAFSLYKASDPTNRLSSGEVREAAFKTGVKEALDLEFEVKKGRQYVALVPRKNASGKPVINDLNEEPNAMFSLQGKEVFLKFKINELVTQVKDL